MILNDAAAVAATAQGPCGGFPIYDSHLTFLSTFYSTGYVYTVHLKVNGREQQAFFLFFSLTMVEMALSFQMSEV